MPAPDDAFISLARWLRDEPNALTSVRATEPVLSEAATVAAVRDAAASLPSQDAAGASSDDAIAGDAQAAARDVRLFRAHLADAFDAARIAVVHEFAFAVLGRELLLAPPDLDAIAARVLAEHPRAQCLRLRVASGDETAVHANIPVETDERLAPGDVVLELAAGTVDARLGTRLAVVLAAWS